jgi:dTDP-glucose 4,6-dehydratase
MNILVTGAAGFIGYNFYRSMSNTFGRVDSEDRDMFPIPLDIYTYASQYDFRGLDCEFVDIRDIKALRKVFFERRPKIIVNFAAETHVDNSIKNSNDFYSTNIQGTINLLECSKEFGIDKFIQISTDEVYGSSKLEIDDIPFTEESKLNPSSPYSSSKAAAELIAMSYYHTFGLPVIVTRSCNNYGPYQHQEKFIPTIINSLLNNKKIPVYGNGLNMRDWIYVGDNVRAIRLIIEKGKVGEIYNISCKDEWSNLGIISKIYNVLYMYNSEKLLNNDNIEFVTDRLGHDKRYSIDSKKLYDLGFSGAENNMVDNLKTTIEWYKNRPNRKLV